MEAENKITHFYSSLFHGDRDGPCAAAVDGISFRRCRCQPCVEADVLILTQETSASVIVVVTCIKKKKNGAVRVCQFGCLV